MSVEKVEREKIQLFITILGGVWGNSQRQVRVFRTFVHTLRAGGIFLLSFRAKL